MNISKKVAISIALATKIALASPYSITLDTGHTPKRYGAMGSNGITEYEYNAEITKRIDLLLNEVGVKVHNVPIKDNLTLTERVKYASNSNLFISIHHDSFGPLLKHRKNELKGFSLFVSKENPQYEKSLKCAKEIGKSLEKAGEQRSRYHELPIKGENKKLLHKVGVYQYNNLYVLRNAQQPAILIEVGVIANPGESKRLWNKQTQNKLSIAISKGITKCLTDL